TTPAGLSPGLDPACDSVTVALGVVLPAGLTWTATASTYVPTTGSPTLTASSLVGSCTSKVRGRPFGPLGVIVLFSLSTAETVPRTRITAPSALPGIDGVELGGGVWALTDPATARAISTLMDSDLVHIFMTSPLGVWNWFGPQRLSTVTITLGLTA